MSPTLSRLTTRAHRLLPPAGRVTKTLCPRRAAWILEAWVNSCTSSTVHWPNSRSSEVMNSSLSPAGMPRTLQLTTR
eukprot:3730803-Lingulodinium_polyedra.AAC.1